MANLTLRTARPADADALSALIVRTLHVSNLPDYGEENIARVAANFTPELIRSYMARWTMFVAEQDGTLIGTASHFEGSARAVFVDPDVQRSGAGRALMEAVIDQARREGDTALTLRASLAAVPFYTALGFASGRDLWNGTERTVEMSRPLS